MERRRLITPQERKLLETLIERSPQVIAPIDWQSLRVRDLRDGGMGSIELLLPSNPQHEKRKFGEQAGEVQFMDEDGIPVIATLYLDTEGVIFEIDIWKVDYSPLMRFPDSFSDSEGSIAAK